MRLELIERSNAFNYEFTIAMALLSISSERFHSLEPLVLRLDGTYPRDLSQRLSSRSRVRLMRAFLAGRAVSHNVAPNVKVEVLGGGRGATLAPAK